jgi:hypothetical protein
VQSKKESPFDPNFVCGIELEVENARSRHGSFKHEMFGTLWNSHTDGSLRNGGVEYVSVPCSGGAIVEAVDLMWNGLPADWSFSQRTSIHVHVNVRDFSWEQLQTLLLTYCVVERILFDYASSDRAGSIFCVPVVETTYPDTLIGNLITSQHRAVGSWEKYSALNLTRLVDLGTVEFRHMPGCRDKEKVFMWLRIINDLLLFARRTTIDTVYKTLESTGPRAFLENVFSSDVMQVIAHKEIFKLCRKGIDSVFSALHGKAVTNQLLSGVSTESPFNVFLKRKQ